MIATDAKQKLDALKFWDKHGLIVTLDSARVSCAILYLWKKCFDKAGVSAL